MSTDPRTKAREQIIRYKLYDALSVCFFIFGIITLIYTYSTYMQSGGGVKVFLKNPVMALILISPFIPASFFSWLSTRKKREFQNMVYGQPDQKTEADT